jgi:FMN phosphatase YigB (HAD superfamily)/DNA-binding XRE family transcriptional regulator
MDEKDLGKRLQAARQTAGLTQQKLCQQANLSFSTLTKIERGAIKSPSIFTIQSIAGALGVSLDELVGQASLGNGRRQLSKTKTGVSFIYFDVNGCLINSPWRAMARLSQATGVPSDIVEMAFWHYNDDVCRGTMSMSDFNTKLAERLKIDEVKWQDYYLEMVEPVSQMQELLKWAAEHYKVGLMTNIMPGLLGSIRHNGQLPHLPYDSVVDSSEVATIKPEIKMYEIAQEQADCPASEILLIDDSKVNLMAAEKLGWHVLWFDEVHPEESVERVRAALEPAS